MALERLKDPQGNRGSDVLLMALLNANRPAKYRANVVVADSSPQKQIVATLTELARGGKRIRAKMTTEVEVEEAEGVRAVEG